MTPARTQLIALGMIFLLLGLAIFGVSALNLWPVLGYGLLAVAVLYFIRATLPESKAAPAQHNRSVH